MGASQGINTCISCTLCKKQLLLHNNFPRHHHLVSACRKRIDPIWTNRIFDHLITSLFELKRQSSDTSCHRGFPGITATQGRSKFWTSALWRHLRHLIRFDRRQILQAIAITNAPSKRRHVSSLNTSSYFSRVTNIAHERLSLIPFSIFSVLEYC